jgi:hypothetical protein
MNCSFFLRDVGRTSSDLRRQDQSRKPGLVPHEGSEPELGKTTNRHAPLDERSKSAPVTSDDSLYQRGADNII